MAKKKSEDAAATATATLDFRQQLRSSIIQKYGAGIAREMSEIKAEKKLILPVSPAVDRAINGGIPEGSWVILSGPEKMGKTTLALQIAANAQKPENGSKTVYYLDVEGRFKDMNLSTVAAFNPDMCEHIRSQTGKILTAEDYLSIAIDIIKGHPGCILIIDSASALCAAKEMTEDLKAQARNDGPKLLATFCRQMGNVVPINNVTVIIIQHLIANTSGYGPAKMEDGGNKIKYQVDVKLRGKGAEKWMLNTDTQIGQLAHWDVIVSALGPPGAKIQSYVRYGYGIDDVMELIEAATDFGIINKGGSWYSFEMGDEEIKAQGMEKMCTLLREDKDKYDFVYNQVKAI